MDIELAGPMNGITAAEKIHAVGDVPVIFLTGFSQDPLLRQAKIAAPYGYLIKPVPERELAATVEIALHRHSLDRQLRENQLALEKSEARYRDLFENSPLGIFRTSLDGRALAVNQEMARIVGCATPEEAIASFSDLARTLYVDPSRRREFIATLRRQEVLVNHFEYEGRKRNGERIWISMNARISISELDECTAALAGDPPRRAGDRRLRHGHHRTQAGRGSPAGQRGGASDAGADAAGHHLSLRPPGAPSLRLGEYQQVLRSAAGGDDRPLVR